MTHLNEIGSSGWKGMAKRVTNISHSGENRKLALCLLLEGDTEDLWPSTRKYLSPRKCHSAICLHVAIKFGSVSVSKWGLEGITMRHTKLANDSHFNFDIFKKIEITNYWMKEMRPQFHFDIILYLFVQSNRVQLTRFPFKLHLNLPSKTKLETKSFSLTYFFF